MATLAYSGLNSLNLNASPLSSQAGSGIQLSSRLAVGSGRFWAQYFTLYWPFGDSSAPLYLQRHPLKNQLQEVKPTLSPTHTPAWVPTKPRGEKFCSSCYCFYFSFSKCLCSNHWVPAGKHIKPYFDLFYIQFIILFLHYIMLSLQCSNASKMMFCALFLEEEALILAVCSYQHLVTIFRESQSVKSMLVFGSMSHFI